MTSERFNNWLVKNENKTAQTGYRYSNAINKISEHYSKETRKAVDLYAITDLDELEIIKEHYNSKGKFSEFGNIHHGLYRAAIKALCRFRENTANIDFKKGDEHNLNINAIKNSSSDTLQIQLYPEDSDKFKQLLLKHKTALIKTFYNNKSPEIKEWIVNEFSESSNVMGNLRSRPEFRQGNWQKLGIKKVEVKIIYSGKT